MRRNKGKNSLDLGRNIARLRRLKGYTNQGDLADKAGVARGSLADIERGAKEGHLNTRRSIAETLGVTLAELYKEPRLIPIDCEAVSHAALILARLAVLSPQRLEAVYALIFDDADLARKHDLVRFLGVVK